MNDKGAVHDAQRFRQEAEARGAAARFHHETEARDRTANTLLLDAIDRLGALEMSIKNSDAQRTMILTEIRDIRQELKTIPLLNATVNRLEPLVEASRDFALRLEGGLMATRVIWLIFGGIGAWLLNYVITHWKS